MARQYTRQNRAWVTTKTIRRYVRRWLNPRSYVASAYSQGGFITTRLTARPYSVSVGLRIGDCDRHIDLDLDADQPEDRDKTVKKLNILIDEITALRDAVANITYVKEKK